MLGIGLLGVFRLTRDGHPLAAPVSSRMQALVACLALNAGTAMAREQLAGWFWPDSSESQARTNLRQLLYHLRSAFPDVDRQIGSTAQALCWKAGEPFTLDTNLFEKAVTAGALDEAARLYRGDLLPAVDDLWVEPVRRRFGQLYEQVLESLIARSETAGDYSAAIRHAESLLSRDALRESSYRTLMRLHERNGDRAAALHVYDRCLSVLRRELNVGPDSATRRFRDRLLGTRPAVPQARETPLIGRAREWECVLQAWRGAAAGHASFLLVAGEAGIGKTRLVEELRLLAGREGASTAASACYRAEKPMALGPVAEWLRAAEVRRRLAALGVARRSQIARVLPELLAESPELGQPEAFVQSWQRLHLFEALTTAILSAPEPLLLLIDDLQWCDPETIDWLHYLIRSNPAARLLVAGTARLEETGPTHPVVPTLRELCRGDRGLEIRLEALSEAETSALAAEVSHAKIDAASAAWLYGHTRGNPLFIVETVRAGLVAGGEGATLSPKVHAVLAARLAQLSGPAQELAGVAAAVGRPFTADLAGRVCQCAEDSVAGSLDELLHRRILIAHGSGSYEFSHGQFGELAYSELGPARRRLLDRRIAEALEADGDDDSVSARIAEHYERAGAAAEAIRHYQRAARAVRSRFAEREAIAYLTKALALVESLPSGGSRDSLELSLLVSLGGSLITVEGYASPQAGRVYTRARLLCELTGDSDLRFAVLSGSWAFHVVSGDLEIARDFGRRNLRQAEDRQDAVRAAAARFMIGSATFHLGDLRAAHGHFAACLEGYGAAHPEPRFFDLGPDLEVFCRSNFAHSLWLLGEPERAAAEMQRTVQVAESISHPFSLALALAYRALLHQFRGEWEPAERGAREAAELCHKYGFQYYLAWTPIVRGWALAERGEAEEGLARMQEGFAAFRATGALLRAPYYLTLMARACHASGRTAQGLQIVAQARAVAHRSGESWMGSELERVKGDLLADSGQPHEALACYRAALRLARGIGAVPFEARAMGRLGNSARTARNAV